MIDIVGLTNEVKLLEKNVITDGYLMSLGELVNLYKSNPQELIINPKYQRVFRWTKEQKSKLIESLILGLPLPGIFVAENEKGQWEVVDGLQRISTILEFMGELIGEELIGEDDKLSNGLESTLLLKGLGGVKWSDLPEEHKLRIKRTRVYVSILKNAGDLKAKYEVFQRLNTGGTKLSDQEVRNCIIIDRKEEYYDKIKDMASDNHFSSLISIIGEQAFSEKQDMEMVLRYLALKNVDLQKEIIIKDLIDSFIYKIVGLEDEKNPFFGVGVNIEDELVIFKTVFKELNDIIGSEIFFPRDSIGNISMKRMKYPVFDTIAQGVGFNFSKGNIDFSNKVHRDTLKQKIIDLQKEGSYMTTEIYKSGNGSARRFKLCAIFGKDYFNLSKVNE